MLTWLYDLLMTFVSFVLSLFGSQMNKKGVSFADEVENKDGNEVADSTDTGDNMAGGNAASTE